MAELRQSMAKQETLGMGGGRALTHLVLGMVLALVLGLLNITINFRDPIRSFFVGYSRLPLADWLVWFLLFWLMLLLWLAYQRWRAASRHQRELENIVSSISPDALLVVNQDDVVILANESLNRLLGYGAREIVGMKTNLLYDHWRLGSDSPRALRDGLARDGFYMGIASGKHRNGEKIPLEIIGADLRDGLGRVMLLRDIRERVMFQDKQGELERRAEQWKKFESLAVLAGGIAHDFKNLLTAISANADVALHNQVAGSEVGGFLVNVVKAADRAAGLCDQMLTYSGEMTLGADIISISDCARQAGQMLDIALPPQVTLNYTLGPDLPPCMANMTQVQQVIASVMANAFEAMQGKEGVVSLCAGVQDYSVEELAATYVDDGLLDGPYLYCEIEDTGCGMDAAMVERMFDPFYTTKRTGRGLELSFALGIIRSLSGAVVVRSEPGRGTLVRIILPTVETQRSALDNHPPRLAMEPDTEAR